MSKYTSWWYKLWSKITGVFSEIKWEGLLGWIRGTGKGYNLTDDDWKHIADLLSKDYYIILTRRKTHLTTYMIAIITWIKTGRWPEYTHALMNLDLVNNPDEFMDFKLQEATSSGVHFSKFNEVFDCDSVCLLEPQNLDKEEWKAVMRGLAEQLGKQYDNVFDVYDDSHVSCVEMVLDSLRDDPNYASDFGVLEQMIQKARNLTPQMYRDCADFKVVFEIKR